MKLWTYVGKKVSIDFIDGQRLTGKVTNYDDEMDNESGEDSIHFEYRNSLYDIDESEIKSIEVLD
ncbi:LSM domain protein [Staphylococcus sp. SQ8-PEA]|uniref:LSM domain protein n=1 Tax=Staphylococcus marylandisciuri TaxID=2981529 RepID=A0ABT2QPL2_9STAP|nr:LSM domain protein [Staphylococcus marylandisciuri]MCU5745895.1 LSM domain protein [Staphylococcus marylandisciuri]